MATITLSHETLHIWACHLFASHRLHQLKLEVAANPQSTSSDFEFRCSRIPKRQHEMWWIEKEAQKIVLQPSSASLTLRAS